MIDIFNDDAFSTRKLTAAILKMPRTARVLLNSGIFTAVPQSTNKVSVEELDQRLGIVPEKQRGSEPTYAQPEKRTLRPFQVPHFPHTETIYADDVRFSRALGTDAAMQTVEEAVARKLQTMNARFDATMEYRLASAIQGLVKDDQGATQSSFYTDFDVSEQTVDFELSDANTKVQKDIEDALDKAWSALGDAAPTGWMAICGRNFFTDLRIHDSVQNAFDRPREGQFLRDIPVETFFFAGVTWVYYPGVSLSGQQIFPVDEARLLPMGVPDAFQIALAPADTFDAPAQGQRVFVRREIMPGGKGMQLQGQQNALALPTRPAAMVKMTKS